MLLNRSTGRQLNVAVVHGVQREEEEQDSATDVEEREEGTIETRVEYELLEHTEDLGLDIEAFNMEMMVRFGREYSPRTI